MNKKTLKIDDIDNMKKNISAIDTNSLDAKGIGDNLYITYNEGTRMANLYRKGVRSKRLMYIGSAEYDTGKGEWGMTFNSGMSNTEVYRVLKELQEYEGIMNDIEGGEMEEGGKVEDSIAGPIKEKGELIPWSVVISIGVIVIICILIKFMGGTY